MRGPRHNRVFATVLLAAVLVAKLLIPVGWMPVQSPTGITMMLCSGDHSSAAMMMAAGKARESQQDSGKQRGAKDTCPYGALNASTNLPAQPAIAPHGFSPAAGPVLAAHAVGVGHGLAAPPPPATGPPLSV